jgi:DNA-directed RNA polymerase specialized sigma24 family protein
VADDAALWELFRAVARGDRDAWPALMAALEPQLLVMAKRAPIGRLRTRDDSPRDIVAAVFARLHARDYAAIRALCDGEPVAELGAWLRVIVRRAAIDYMRGTPEFARGTPQRAPGWVSLASLSSSAQGPAVDSRANKRELITMTVREMVARTAAEVKAHGDDAYAVLALEWKIPRLHIRRLASRGEQFLVVLAGVFDGSTQQEIAERLGISRREVELTVRYLEQLLQARFSEP